MLEIVTVKDDRDFYIDLLEKVLNRRLVDETLSYRDVLTNLEEGPFISFTGLRTRPKRFELVALTERLEEVEEAEPAVVSNISVVLSEAYQYYDSRTFLSRKNKLFRYLVWKYRSRINFIISSRKLSHIDKGVKSLEHKHTEV